MSWYLSIIFWFAGIGMFIASRPVYEICLAFIVSELFLISDTLIDLKSIFKDKKEEKK